LNATVHQSDCCLVERLFEVIDKDGSGTIAYNEFIYGLAILFRGTRKEKLKFIFDLYDLSEWVHRQYPVG
jgi:Ca2+-binding EF-hand superfamily protein